MRLAAKKYSEKIGDKAFAAALALSLLVGSWQDSAVLARRAYSTAEAEGYTEEAAAEKVPAEQPSPVKQRGASERRSGSSKRKSLPKPKVDSRPSGEVGADERERTGDLSNKPSQPDSKGRKVSVSGSTAETLSEAMHYADNMQFAQTTALLDAARLYRNLSAQNYAELAQLYLRVEHYDRAKELVDMALSRGRKDPGIVSTAIDIYTATGYLDKAVDCGTAFLEGRKNKNVTQSLALALARSGKLQAAFDCIADGFRQTNSSPFEAREVRADLLVKIGAYGEALDVYEGLEKANPEEAFYAISAAEILCKLGKPDNALAKLDRAARVAPLDPSLFACRVTALSALRKSADAEAAAIELVRLQPGREDSYLLAAQVFADQRKLDRALLAVEQGIEALGASDLSSDSRRTDSKRLARAAAEPSLSANSLALNHYETRLPLRLLVERFKLLLSLNKGCEALSQLSQSLSTLPGSVPLEVALAQSQLKEGPLSKETIANLRKQCGWTTEAKLLLARNELAMGRYLTSAATFLDVYKRILPGDSRRASVGLWIGLSLAMGGEKERSAKAVSALFHEVEKGADSGPSLKLCKEVLSIATNSWKDTRGQESAAQLLSVENVLLDEFFTGAFLLAFGHEAEGRSFLEALEKEAPAYSDAAVMASYLLKAKVAPSLFGLSLASLTNLGFLIPALLVIWTAVGLLIFIRRRRLTVSTGSNSFREESTRNPKKRELQQVMGLDSSEASKLGEQGSILKPGSKSSWSPEELLGRIKPTSEVNVEAVASQAPTGGDSRSLAGSLDALAERYSAMTAEENAVREANVSGAGDFASSESSERLTKTFGVRRGEKFESLAEIVQPLSVEPLNDAQAPQSVEVSAYGFEPELQPGSLSQSELWASKLSEVDCKTVTPAPPDKSFLIEFGSSEEERSSDGSISPNLHRGAVSEEKSHGHESLDDSVESSLKEPLKSREAGLSEVPPRSSEAGPETIVPNLEDSHGYFKRKARKALTQTDGLRVGSGVIENSRTSENSETSKTSKTSETSKTAETAENFESSEFGLAQDAMELQLAGSEQLPWSKSGLGQSAGSGGGLGPEYRPIKLGLNELRPVLLSAAPKAEIIWPLWPGQQPTE